MHLFNVEGLKECYERLEAKKAVGIDGVSKSEYGKQLRSNLEELVGKLKQMAYRPGPVRETRIPKEGKPGATRPLGISNFEDKLVQKMMQRVLESIYEPIFLDCSYGFRPGRGCHDTIKAVDDYLYQNEVQTVIDVDLANFFGTIDHQLLEQMLRLKIKDQRLIRYLIRMFKAGVLADGDLRVSEEGVPQGSICSPILANIFAHYVIDSWFKEEVKSQCRGPVEMFRYADDMVIVCGYAQDAQWIKGALAKRLADYKLKLNEEKTQMIGFSKSGYRQGRKQGSFDFLGFTFYLGRSRRDTVIPKVKTVGKRMRSKLKRVSLWARDTRNRYPLGIIWKRFCAKLEGHIRYYGVSHNIRAVRTFCQLAQRILFKWLNRRSQRRSFTWKKFQLYLALHPAPRSRICHRLF
jgi:group II intron reverse transcriptase/maturase